ncbi:thioredoxin family protein [Sediminispirochaeta bajacaliforniensis]|uniref:thioredoxin family protein n=1 Tax=Sediminispirochaeta bajacaliforniensis TaxID=148 RepID=UPI0003671187|nr:thioredoxin family protein [Sediminispirochaeta bajacaliforniensis]
MKIQILGSGCPKCKALEANARQAVAELGMDVEIEKVTNIDEIMEMGVMMTPAIAIDGDVKNSGSILPSEKIIDLIREEEGRGAK